MILYEATNGETGYAYIRAYIWAKTPDEAGKLAGAAFEYKEEGVREKIELRELLRSTTSSFYTEPSDEGWVVENEMYREFRMLGFHPDIWKSLAAVYDVLREHPEYIRTLKKKKMATNSPYPPGTRHGLVKRENI